MKFSLTLLFIFGFIAFIGAAPAEDVADKEPTEPKEDEEVPEVPENSDDEEEYDDDKLEDTALKESEQDEDEDPAEEENNVEDPRKKWGRRCARGGFRWKVTCHGKGKKRKCHRCCTKCKFAHRCRRVRRYKRPVCFYYWRHYCKGHRHRHRLCLKAHWTCFIHGRCWARHCRPVRPPRKG